MTLPNPFAVVKKLLMPKKETGQDGKPPDRSGSIGLYGLSRAGKTVFLTVAFRESTLDIRKAGRFKLTTRHHETLREMLRNRDLLEGRSEYNRPVFPPPTQVSRLFHFDAHVNRKYIYPFRTMDYKGEGLDLTRSSGGQETIEFLSACHCLLFLYEPDEQMLDRKRDDLEYDEPERMRRIELFTTMIENLRKVGDRPKLDMPIGLIITKADQLEGFQSLAEEDTVLLNRKLANAKFTDAADFTRKVLDQPHIRDNPAWRRQVSRILTGLTLFWDHVVAYAPSFQVFFASSTGGTDTFANEMGESEIVPPASFRPKGVLNPLHWVVEMLEVRRRIKQWRRWVLRLALLSLILHAIVGVMNFRVIHRQLGYDLVTLGSSTSVKEQNTALDKKWQYYLYPTLRPRLATISAANRIRMHLLELKKRTSNPRLGKLPAPGDTRGTGIDPAGLTSHQVVQAIERELPRVREVPGLEAKIAAAIEQLRENLWVNIKRNVDNLEGEENPEEAARQLGRDYSLDDPDGDGAVRYYRLRRTGNVRDYITQQYREAMQLGQGQDVTQIPRLKGILKDLSDQFKKYSEAIPGVDRGRIDTWLMALDDPGMNPTLATIYAQQHGFLLLKLWVDTRDAGSVGGGGGPPPSPTSDASKGLDPDYARLVAYLAERRSNPLDYYVTGIQRARGYIGVVRGRTEPGIGDNRAQAQRFVRAMESWQSEGLPASVQVVNAAGFSSFFEVLGDGPEARFLGPHTIGQTAQVTWRLGELSNAPGTGLRLYFSVSQKKPEGPDVARNLQSPLCVVVGIPELLMGKAVTVGSRAVPVTLKLINPEILPALGERPLLAQEGRS